MRTATSRAWPLLIAVLGCGGRATSHPTDGPGPGTDGAGGDAPTDAVAVTDAIASLDAPPDAAVGPVHSWPRSPDHCDGSFIQGDFRAIWFADSAHGFAVASSGIFATTDGGASWHCSDPNFRMNALWGRSATEVYAVGGDPLEAMLMQWDGTSWSTSTFTGTALTAIWSGPGQPLWVTSSAGGVYTIGGGLNYLIGDGNFQLRGIWSADAMHVWAVGGSADGGFAYDNVGENWSWLPITPTGHNLTAISGIDAANAWAVGLAGTITKLSSAAWTTQASSTANDLLGVWARDASHVWAVGAHGFIDGYDGTAWTARPSPTTETLVGISGVDATHQWAAGTDGTIIASGATSWAQQTTGNSWPLRSIAMIDPANVWAITDASDRVLRFDGTHWRHDPAAFGDRPPTSVFALDATHVWVTSQADAIWRWNGATWASDPVPSTVPIAGLWAASPTHAWAVDWNGGVFGWDGTSWTMSTAISAGLFAIAGADSSHVWAVGSYGNIVQWTGTSWVGQLSNTTKDLYTAWAADATHVWAGGETGTIMFYDGTGWTKQTSPTTSRLSGFWGSDATHVWAVDEAGEILVFDGSTWTVQSPGIGFGLYAIGGADAAHIFAGGYDGVILQGTP